MMMIMLMISDEKTGVCVRTHRVTVSFHGWLLLPLVHLFIYIYMLMIIKVISLPSPPPHYDDEEEEVVAHMMIFKLAPKFQVQKC